MRSWRDLVLITSHRVGSVAPDPVDVPAAIRFTARIIRRPCEDRQGERGSSQQIRLLKHDARHPQILQSDGRRLEKGRNLRGHISSWLREQECGRSEPVPRA